VKRPCSDGALRATEDKPLNAVSATIPGRAQRAPESN